MARLVKGSTEYVGPFLYDYSMNDEAHAIRYREPEIDSTLAALFERELGVSSVFARVLVARGFTAVSEVEQFLEPSLTRDWDDPFNIPDMETGAQRVVAALDRGERICVFGDYDLDGVSSAAIVSRALESLGGSVAVVLPSRTEDGYGLTDGAAERIRAVSPDLLITVDCGVSAVSEIAQLTDSGIDVVVTDHHTPGDLIPQGVPIINPKLVPGSPSYNLAGAGVALKLVHAVGVLVGKPTLWRDLVDLATLGTVADVMPLRGENRALVAAGLEKIHTAPYVGIAALADASRTQVQAITAERISFTLAPRLNAAGRVSTPEDAYQLLVTDDPIEARNYAHRLNAHNQARRDLEAEMAQQVEAEIERTYRGERAIVLASEGWHDGVKGIVAARTAGRYGVPAILASVEDGLAVGSGRSVGQINLYDALEATSAHLERYGGHAGAAGMAFRLDAIDTFRAALVEYLDALPDDAFISQVTVDAVVTMDELTALLAEEVDGLEPYGADNRRPLFAAHGVCVKNGGAVGGDGAHLKFQAYQNGIQIPAIYFRCPTELMRAALSQQSCDGSNPLYVDIVFELELDTYRGNRKPRIVVRDMAVCDSTGSGGPEPCDPAQSADWAGDESSPNPSASSQEAQAAVPHTPMPDEVSDLPLVDFIEHLFEEAEDSFLRRDYAGILDAPVFHTKLAGVTFDDRQETIAQLAAGEPLDLRRDHANPYDANAVAVWSLRQNRQLGFLNRDLAAEIAGALDAGAGYFVELADVTGGEEGRSYGVNVRVTRSDAHEVAEQRSNYIAQRRDRWRGLDEADLERQLVRHFIGDGALHGAQAESLAHLSRGRNTLTVMATGRGKSLIFHLHAAKTALSHGGASIFVYPLRALISDQAHHLQESFADLGLNVSVITGESSETARAAGFEALELGQTDIVLTTPEFLYFHRERFQRSGRVRFIVVDEAHHIGQARAGNRPAYSQLGSVIESLTAAGDAPAPTVLAVTATASDEVADRIGQVLGIHERVLDPSVRSNLLIGDVRGLERHEKPRKMLDIVSAGGKSVVYVNSREESVKLARLIRTEISELAGRTAFYNGGLGRKVRHEIERRFREGEISVVIATSAFGEGVNIPDVRNVVLFHMPFSDVEFNQMAGRCGRDGTPATVHLLFGERDASINEYILGSLAPTVEALRALYLALRERAVQAGWNAFQVTNAELADRANALAPKKPGGQDQSQEQPAAPQPAGASRLDEQAVSTGIGVFRELGFLATEGRSSARRITLVQNPPRMDLDRSPRYAEGLDEIEAFDQFKAWALGAGSDELLMRFNRPILPSRS